MKLLWIIVDSRRLLNQNQTPELPCLLILPDLILVRISTTGSTDCWTLRPFSPLHRELCFSASGCKGGRFAFASRVKSERLHRSVLWQTEVTHIQREPCLFCMAKWGRGWRVATETLGSGQTSPHFSTYSMFWICIALHLLHRWSAVFLQSAWWKMQLVWGHPPPSPDTHCCHDRQRSPLDRGSAGWWRGRLIWDGGLHLRMLFCLWSL